MIKKLVTIYLFLMLTISHILLAQQLISTAGEFQQNSNGSLSWTIGEVFTETLGNDNSILTQGFQQGDLTVTTLLDDLSFQLSIYPNPVSNVLIIKTDNTIFTYRLWDMKGHLVKEGSLAGNNKQISFAELIPGQYILQSDELTTHKIIKE